MSRGSCLTVAQMSHAALSSLHGLSSAPKPNSQTLAPELSQDVSTLALLVMRRALKTDIALLQKRDLFYVEALEPIHSPARSAKPTAENFLERRFRHFLLRQRLNTPCNLEAVRRLCRPRSRFSRLPE